MADSSGKVSFTSFVKKVRMGKRIEKAFGRDKTASSAAGESHDDDPNRTPEPHMCTGHFQNDFTELCRRNQMAVIPPVVLRPHRPPSPSAVLVPEEKTKPGKKDDKKNQPPPEPEPEPSLDENGEPPEPPPKTYCTKEKFEYFKPTVQVEMDNPDKLDTVTEVYIRGWKVDEPMMVVFKQCWPKMDRLHTISLWYTGLTDESLDVLSQVLPDCVNLRTLILDNNPIKGETWHTLIKEDSPVQQLSLRYNNISDVGAANLGKVLGTVSQQNQKLISLNLNGNHITDAGAEALAGGLRMNRTLLSLGLAHNQISNKGAHTLADVVSKFALTHEEIVERRRLLSTAPDRKSPTAGGKRSDSRDRPGSVRSTHGGGTKGKSANKTKKDGKKEDDKNKGKKQDDRPQKKEPRSSRGGGSSSGRGSGASVVAESTKGGTKKGHDRGKAKKGAQLQEQEPAESGEPQSPLLDMIEPLKDGVILLKGNMNLINLNLSHNHIGEEGIRLLLTAVQYQTSILELKGSKPGNTGLMRLCVSRNKVAQGCEPLTKLNDLMHSKDPFYKPPAKSPDQDSQHG